MGLISNIFVLNPPSSAASVFLILSYVQSSNKNSSLYQFAPVVFVLDHCTHRRTERETVSTLNQELNSRHFIQEKKDKVKEENNERVLVSSGGSSFRPPPAVGGRTTPTLSI